MTFPNIMIKTITIGIPDFEPGWDLQPMPGLERGIQDILDRQ